MHKVLIFISLFCVSLYSLSSTEINMMNGSWDCSELIEDDGYISNIIITDSYNVESYTFTSNGTVDLKYKTIPIFKFKIYSQGVFTVDKDVYTPIFTSVDIDLISGDMPLNEINQFKQELFNDKGSYKTIKINAKEWVAIDLTDNTESVCKKI